MVRALWASGEGRGRCVGGRGRGWGGAGWRVGERGRVGGRAVVVVAAVGSSVAAVPVGMVATAVPAAVESPVEVAGLSAWSVLKPYQ